MIAALGYLSIVIALTGAALMTFRAIRVSISGDPLTGANQLRLPTQMLLIGAVGAMLLLEVGLLTNDFSLAYVANHHRSTTPFIFTIATAWAALEGSIVLWGLVLAGFSWLVFRDQRSTRSSLSAGALAVMGMVAIFFFGIMATIANPFEICTAISGSQCIASSALPWSDVARVADGLGPNPLLQNHILMAIHPPILYVGYVGMTVPFAYAMSALALRLPGIEWARRTKQWTLIAWSFLTTGILLGGWWSYEVLGWGGYWAWDPVENASFIPWLMATAFIHSSFVQMRRGMLQAWNFVLVIATFSATILGTFLTRSGTMASVHAFASGPVGPALLGFLTIVIIASFALFATRSHLVAQAPRLESLASREGAFLYNNLLLTVFGFVVLIGTLFPLIAEATTGTTVGIGRPFFDQFAIPLSFGLLLAMGVGPVMPYRIAKSEAVLPQIRTPFQVGLLAGAGMVVIGIRDAWPILSISAAVFVGSVLLRHFVTQARTSATRREEPMRDAMLRLLRNDPSYWGGQISHLGVAILAIGIATSGGLSSTNQITLAPGEQTQIADYTITYVTPFETREANRLVTGARLDLEIGNRTIVMDPRVNTYENPPAIPTPAVYSALRGDVYATITGISSSGVNLTLWWFPLQWMVWLGGIVTALGGAWSSLLRKQSETPTSVNVGV